MNERLPKFKGEKLLDEITKSTTGLTYISETDAAIEPFFAARDKEKNIFNRIAGHQLREEREASEFFSRLTKIRDWFGPREIARAKRFALLEKLLAENLHDIKAIRIGRINIDIYVVGRDADENLVGIKTKAVET
jgi:hypothetical protein